MLLGKTMKPTTSLFTSIYIFTLLSFVMACTSAEGADNNTMTIPAKAIKQDERISFYDNQVSFIPPAGFKSLTRKQLKRNLPDNANPVLILANSDQTGSITIGLDDTMRFHPQHLAEIKKFTEGIHRNYSGWITSELVEMNGREWYHFEYVTPEMDELAKLVAPPEKGAKPQKTPDDTPYHYHMYSTVFEGKLLSFGFNAHVQHYSQLKDGYLKSIKSIRIKD
jgi:hypothetical protein